jgi:hypothetical protein
VFTVVQSVPTEISQLSHPLMTNLYSEELFINIMFVRVKESCVYCSTHRGTGTGPSKLCT